MTNQIIRTAINKIGSFYPDGLSSWLKENNVISFNHLQELQDKVDCMAIANDIDGLRNACNLWVSNWEFWAKRFVVEKHFGR